MRRFQLSYAPKKTPADLIVDVCGWDLASDMEKGKTQISEVLSSRSNIKLMMQLGQT